MKITTINGLHEAIKNNVPLNRIYFSDKRKDKRISELITLCKEVGLAFRIIPEEALRRKVDGEHQGLFCEAMPKEPKALSDWAFSPETQLILALDHIWDPGNLGAIIRNAACGGVNGILLSTDRSSPLNETVLTRSAGTLLTMNFSLCSNLVNEIKVLKKNNFWIAGACGGGEKTLYEWDFSLPTVLVMGNEQRGISSPLRKQLDVTLSIPMNKGSESLNVASASAVFIFEAARQQQIMSLKKRGS